MLKADNQYCFIYFNSVLHDTLYVKGAACADKPTDNYHPALQFPSALRRL